MGFNCGIVGLPNVGKSTVFNALAAAGAAAENYPFCAINPNKGVVPVPDDRLAIIATIAKSAQVIPTTVEFVDIAGLVKGAAEGQGLGNQFLGHIRAVDAIVHVVRCFDDPNATHVEGSPSPVRDIELVETELLLADLATVEARLEKVARAAKCGEKEKKLEHETLEIAKKCLSEGRMPHHLPDPQGLLQSMGILSRKPYLYLANVSEKDVALVPDNAVAQSSLGVLHRFALERRVPLVVICGKIEAEIATLPEEERGMFLSDLGLTNSGLNRLSLAGYKLLELITFFTAGPKESRAWTCRCGSKAPQAAGKIHSDFERGFIRAEVISYDDYVSCGGETKAQDKGLLRIEGKEYVVRDGDVMHFRFNV